MTQLKIDLNSQYIYQGKIKTYSTRPTRRCKPPFKRKYNYKNTIRSPGCPLLPPLPKGVRGAWTPARGKQKKRGVLLTLGPSL